MLQEGWFISVIWTWRECTCSTGVQVVISIRIRTVFESVKTLQFTFWSLKSFSCIFLFALGTESKDRYREKVISLRARASS